MGQRCMSNAFARAYFKRIGRAFELWKEWQRADKHKEAIIRNTLQHMLKASGKNLLAIFMHWKALSKINDTKKQIADMEYQINDMGLVQNGDST